MKGDRLPLATVACAAVAYSTVIGVYVWEGYAHAEGFGDLYQLLATLFDNTALPLRTMLFDWWHDPSYYLLFRWLTVFHSPALIIFVWSAYIGAGALPLFLVCRRRLAPWPSAAVALSYLVVFPLWGVGLHSFGTELFFPTAFFAGVWAYEDGRLAWAFAFVVLAGLMHYPFSVFTAIFGLAVMRAHRRMGVALVAVAFLAFVVAAYAVGVWGALQPDPVNQPWQAWDTPPGFLTTVAVLFLPVFWVSLLSRRWLPFMAPYFFLIVRSGFHASLYPQILTGSHAVLIVPFMLLGFADVAPRIPWRKGVPLLVLVLVVLSNVPYKADMRFYTSYDTSVPAVAGICGFDFPGTSPGAVAAEALGLLPPGSKVAVTGMDDAPYAYAAVVQVWHTFPDFHGSVLRYPWLSPSNFSLASAFFAVPVTGPASDVPVQYMDLPSLAVFNAMWASGGYSLAVEADGVVLLERGPVSSPLYVPIRAVCGPRSVTYFMENHTVFMNEAYFPPGSYVASLQGHANQTGGTGALSLVVDGASAPLSGEVGFTLHAFAPVSIYVASHDWEGFLYTQDVTVTQVGGVPPPP